MNTQPTEGVAIPDPESMLQLRACLQRLTQMLHGQCEHVWDINVLHRIHQQAGRLARRYREHGEDAVESCLLALRAELAPIIASGRTPGATAAAALASMDQQLHSLQPKLREPASSITRPDADGHCHVLLVGLDDDDAERLQGLLSQDPGTKLLFLSEPLSTLEHLDAFKPHLILLNMNMPVCDSADLADMIRGCRGFATVPIVHVTAEASDAASGQTAISLAQTDAALSRALWAHLPAGGNAEPRPHTTGQQEHSRRAWLLDRLESALDSTEGLCGGLLDIGINDLDGLRQDNSVGEIEAMRAQLGTLMQELLQPGDMLCEDDDAFLLLSRERNYDNLLALADELMLAIRRERFGTHALPLSVSIGGYALDGGLDQVDSVRHGARQARIEAGPDQIGWHRKGNKRIKAADLETALDERRLHHVFQAIADLRGGQVPKYQALIRLRDRNGFVHNAGELLPVARQAGLVARLDRMSLDIGLELLASEQRRTRPLHLFINQSSDSLRAGDYPASLAARLSYFGTRAARLILAVSLDELDESGQPLQSVATQIRELGVGLCLTDVDHSARALKLLDSLPLDYIKLTVTGGSTGTPTMLTSIAHERSLAVIATQVEDEAQLQILRHSGVDYAQGHSLAHPSRTLSYRFDGK